MKKRKRFFITIEGGEGSGKTTQSLFLKEYFKRRNYKVLLTREPGGTDLAESIRRILLNPNSNIVPLSELFLYEAARAQHIKKIVLPALQLGKIVICDRFTDSTVAYQCYGRKLDLGFINSLNFVASYGLTPDLTIYLDITPVKGLTEAKKLNREFSGGVGDRFEMESIRFHNNVRKGYLNQAQKYPRRIKVVKVQKTLAKTQILIQNILNTVL
jgi:dTMP kinase